MNERMLYDENQEPLMVIPVVHARTTTTLGDIELDFTNTRLRNFPGKPDMDHLEYTTPEGRLIGITYSQLEEHTQETLTELGYPATVEPIPSEADIRWYDSVVMDRLNVHVIEVPDAAPAPIAERKLTDGASLAVLGATGLLLAFAAESYFGKKKTN